jgi:hypothetical protein
LTATDTRRPQYKQKTTHLRLIKNTGKIHKHWDKYNSLKHPQNNNNIVQVAFYEHWAAPALAFLSDEAGGEEGTGPKESRHEPGREVNMSARGAESVKQVNGIKI